MTPNKENIRLLVEALRSGEYHQGNRVLGRPGLDNSPDTFCCLGVACEVAIKAGIPLQRRTGGINGHVNIFIYEAEPNEEAPTNQQGSDTRGVYLHPLAQEFFGLTDYNPNLVQASGGIATAAIMNDSHGADFLAIADAFERTYLTDTDAHEGED